MSLCGNCFREPRKAGPCPYCGWDGSGQAEKYPLALKVGAILNGRYTVGRVLGQGGFGVTYIAQDYNSKQRVAIKEYLPTEMAGRNGSTCAVQLYSGERRENFEYGKEQFLQEAKTLANFIGDAHIVRIHSYFEENATAYFVMDYVEGQPLNRYMTGFGGRLSVEEAGRLLLPLMESLARVHAAGIIHRDIAPAAPSSSTSARPATPTAKRARASTSSSSTASPPRSSMPAAGGRAPSPTSTRSARPSITPSRARSRPRRSSASTTTA